MHTRVRQTGSTHASIVLLLLYWVTVNALTPADPDGLYRSRSTYFCTRCTVQTARGAKYLRLSAVCRNSIDNDDPRCTNGGYLRAKNTTEQTNCAVCECPKGWGGVDCSGMSKYKDQSNHSSHDSLSSSLYVCDGQPLLTMLPHGLCPSCCAYLLCLVVCCLCSCFHMCYESPSASSVLHAALKPCHRMMGLCHPSLLVHQIVP